MGAVPEKKRMGVMGAEERGGTEWSEQAQKTIKKSGTAWHGMAWCGMAGNAIDKAREWYQCATDIGPSYKRNVITIRFGSTTLMRLLIRLFNHALQVQSQKPCPSTERNLPNKHVIRQTRHPKTSQRPPL